MNRNPEEELLQAMRIGLTYALQLEREGKHEAANAAGARAANKLALAIYVQRQNNVIPFPTKEQ